LTAQVFLSMQYKTVKGGIKKKKKKKARVAAAQRRERSSKRRKFQGEKNLRGNLLACKRDKGEHIETQKTYEDEECKKLQKTHRRTKFR